MSKATLLAKIAKIEQYLSKNKSIEIVFFDAKTNEILKTISDNKKKKADYSYRVPI